ncbi:unnamed protein product [Effrenium voratum]|uniref:Uncharacterized protein n=1 Tax=Effrenium voratum TaxID=2562239 RepID=A0AA36MIG7_9DINO|nr:unnamed protein product [Effrenium voratum]
MLGNHSTTRAQVLPRRSSVVLTLCAVTAKRKEFKAKDFVFVVQDSSAPSRDFLNDATSQQKCEALLKMHRQLTHEQKAWRTHLQRLKAFEDFELSDWNTQTARQEEKLEEAWSTHSLAFYQVHEASDIAAAMRLVASHRQLADALTPLARADVPVVCEWNIPKAGVDASKHIGPVVQHIALSCSSDPQMTIHIVPLGIPPCQPMYGKGEATGDQRLESIQQHIDRWHAELVKPQHKLLVRKVHATWDAATFYSPDRELGWEVWLVLSESVRARNKTHVYNHIFGNSTLMKRGAFPTFLQSMERRDFKNWRVPLGFDGSGNVHRNQATEMLQWFSGSVLHSCIIEALAANSILTDQSRVQVADCFMLDDQPVASCISLNCQEKAGVPRVAYIGVAWWHEKKLTREVVQENVASSACAMLKQRLRQKTYRVDTGVAIPDVQDKAGSKPGARPEHDPKDFELTFPRANLELPLKVPTIRQAEALGNASVPDPASPQDATLTLTWARMRQLHDNEFCPSGFAYDPDTPNKRKADPQTEGARPAVKLTPVTAPDGLLQTGVASSEWQVLLHPNGELFLKALKDGSTSSSETLFWVKGSFKVGAVAKEEKQAAGSQHVPAELSESSRVTLALEPPQPDKEIPKFPITVDAALTCLAGHRLAVSQIFKHKHVDQAQGTQKYKVTPLEDIVLVPDTKPLTGLKGVVATDMLSTYANLSKLQNLEVINTLKYNVSTKGLKQGLPAVHFTSCFQLKEGETYKL